MDMRSEDDFRKALTKRLVSMGAHVSNIESHVSSAGIPDMNFFLSGRDVWLELKATGPKGLVKMRPTQRKWHSDRWAAGGESFVSVLLIGTDHILAVPGNAAAGLDTRVASWEAVSREQNMVVDNLTSLIRMLIHGTEQQSNRKRTPQSAGSPGTAFPPGGEDVGSHHWLLDKP